MSQHVLALDPSHGNLLEYRIHLLLLHPRLRAHHVAQHLNLLVKLCHNLLAARVQADDLLFERPRKRQQLPPVDKLVTQPRRAVAEIHGSCVGGFEH